MIEIRCLCGEQVQVGENFRGHEIRCPKCDTILPVPMLPPPTAAAGEARSGEAPAEPTPGPTSPPVEVQGPPAPASQPRLSAGDLAAFKCDLAAYTKDVQGREVAVFVLWLLVGLPLLWLYANPAKSKETDAERQYRQAKDVLRMIDPKSPYLLDRDDPAPTSAIADWVCPATGFVLLLGVGAVIMKGKRSPPPCPACGGYPFSRRGLPRHCPNCGVSLE